MKEEDFHEEESPSLTLSRETLLRLDEPKLRTMIHGGNATLVDTEDAGCQSPRCGPTYWESCDCTV